MLRMLLWSNVHCPNVKETVCQVGVAITAASVLHRSSLSGTQRAACVIVWSCQQMIVVVGKDGETRGNLTSLLIAFQFRINAASSSGRQQLSPPVRSHKTTMPSRFSGFLKAPVRRESASDSGFPPCLGCVFVLLTAICLLSYPFNVLGVSVANS